MSNETFLFVDVETTGVDPKTNSVIEIGAIAYQNGKQIGEEFEQSCRPYKKEINLGALEVNRVGPYELFAPEDSQTMADDFVEFILTLPKAYRRSIIICGHNVNFDLEFIDDFLKFHNYMDFKEFVSYRTIDTFPIGQFLVDNNIVIADRANLASLSKALEVGYDEGKHHTALYDAKLSAKVYFKMSDIVKEKTGISTTAQRNWK